MILHVFTSGEISTKNSLGEFNETKANVGADI